MYNHISVTVLNVVHPEISFTIFLTTIVIREIKCEQYSFEVNIRKYCSKETTWNMFTTNMDFYELSYESRPPSLSLFILSSYLCKVCQQACWGTNRYFIWQWMRKDFSVDSIKSPSLAKAQQWYCLARIKPKERGTKAKGTILKHQSDVHYFIKG